MKKNQTTRNIMLLMLLVISIAFAGFTLTGCGGQEGGQDSAQQTQQTEQTQPDPVAEDTERSEAPNGEEPLATLFFASDYQEMDGWPRPEDTLTDILQAAEEDGKHPTAAAYLGDYTNDPQLHDYQLSPEENIDEIRDVLEEECPELDAAETIFVQGNHDRLTESISRSGLHEYDSYLIYVLNTENDFPWKQGKTSGSMKKVQRAAKELKSCFDELIEAGESRPVFIAGHVPLHYTARTSSRHTTGDNLYASLIFDVVNDASQSLDIVYLFGHNHSKGWDCYLGGGSVFQQAGDTLIVPTFAKTDVNTDRFTEQTLAFTYLNAGYTGYYMNCGPEELAAGSLDSYKAADDTLTATVCEVYPGKLVLTRYDADGVHQMRGEGEGDPYIDHIDHGLIDGKYYSHPLDSPVEIPLHNARD